MPIKNNNYRTQLSVANIPISPIFSIIVADPCLSVFIFKRLLHMNGFQVTKPYKVKRVYNQYHLRKDLVEEVFQGFRLYKDKQISMREISVLSNIPTDRLYCWYRKWTNNRDYRPGSQYGKHKRLFTDVQEKAVADFLRIQYVIPGILVRRKHLRYIIRNLWQQYHPEAPLSTKNRVSHHFLRDFCARHKLGFRKPRKKKRSDIKEEEVEQYAREYAEVIAIYPHERILNMDETPLNLLSTKTEVLAEVGTEEVNGQLPGDPKQNFTVICTITASGEKLPPVFLAQGKTPLCHPLDEWEINCLSVGSLLGPCDNRSQRRSRQKQYKTGICPNFRNRQIPATRQASFWCYQVQIRL